MSAFRDDVHVARGVLSASGAPRLPAARLGVAVVQELVTSIITGDVAAGDPLPPEAVLADRFAVSRTVIRESVKRIEEKGLVTVAQGRGTHVLPIRSWNILDPVVLDAMVANDDSLGVLDELAVVRSSLESSMSAEVAENRSSDDVIELEAALERMRETIDDEHDFSQADVDFHFLIAELSGNRLAENITRMLFQRARESARFHANPSPEAFRLTLDEHARIYDAIERGDAAAAETAMRRHILDAWQRRRLPTHRSR
jgi:DNA-binding FadR family transcriptional regulator